MSSNVTPKLQTAKDLTQIARNRQELCQSRASSKSLLFRAQRGIYYLKVVYAELPPIRAPHHFCPPMSAPRGPRPSHSRKGPISLPSSLKLTTSTPKWRLQLSPNVTAAVSTFGAAAPQLHRIHPLTPMLDPSHHAGCTCHPPVHLYVELAHSQLFVFFCRAVKLSVNISQNTHRIPPIALPYQEQKGNSV